MSLLNTKMFQPSVWDEIPMKRDNKYEGVVIDPDYQKQGIGAEIMERIESYLLKAAKKGSTIGLLSAKGKEGFYSRYDYLERPNDLLGNGMCKFI